MLVGAVAAADRKEQGLDMSNPITVGEVEKDLNEEVVALIDELSDGLARIGMSPETMKQLPSCFPDPISFAPQVSARLCAYARSVAHFPTAVKEFEWRNGYFYSLSLATLAENSASDPFPKHTQMLQRVGAVKKTVPKYALLFDCDGVIVETEEMHR